MKQIFVSAMMFCGCNISSANSIKYVSVNNQESKVRPEIININSNEPLFYSYSIKISKCSRNCNNNNDPYSKMCVPDVIKNINVKIFNLISRTNERRYIKWHETCIFKCRLDASVCNNKLCWNNDKCRCQCKELIVKGICDKEFIWYLSNCECECNKLCDVGEYLNYANYKCRKRLVDKLVEECSENIDENKFIVVTFNDSENVCESCERCFCTIHIVLLVTLFIISISISHTKINPSTETVTN